jgi:hypothetical protein
VLGFRLVEEGASRGHILHQQKWSCPLSPSDGTKPRIEKASTKPL